jgi:tetratricopeptide (TPR) repeat protein
MRRCIAHRLAIAAALVVAAPVRAAEPDPEQTRAIMREVFGALQQVLPASLDERSFSDPARRPAIRASLATLSRNAGALSRHGAGRGASFEFLSGSLARESAEIERRYAAGKYREAQFELHEFTENCVACHSRLPDASDAPLSARFMDEKAVAALPLPERARLAMATRQFDRALEAHEAMMTAPEFDVNSLDLVEYLDDYIEVCVRVKQDFARPARTLEAFAKRPGLRSGLHDEVTLWVADLREFGARPPIEGLEPARALVEQTEALARERGEQALLVRYEVASGALNRYVASLPDGDRRAAEAYYWLGVIESRVGRSFWLSQTEPYLEAAIRLAPDQPIAGQAYARLEEFVAGSYTGSSGEKIPPDVAAWLAGLRQLVHPRRGDDRS